ncbi:MAG: efflux RND transporter periplasmic adaptor subunit [Bryobacteraceae bacterium]
MRVGSLLALGVILGGGTVGLGVLVGLRHPTALPDPVARAAGPAVATPETPPVVASSTLAIAAAQGRVEGRSDAVEVEASADGTIQTLLVREGQWVAKDQVIATLSCDNLDSEVRSLEAAIEATKQARARILRGSRDEEKQLAEENVRNAKIILDQAERQNDRMQMLLSKEDIPRQTAEAAQRDFDTAESAWKTAVQRQKLANSGALPEEIAKADAEVFAAEQKLGAAIAQRAKCTVRSPINGTVTHVNLHVGEAFSTVVPRPIVTIADLSERRIRAEVDERDLAKIHVNQRVRIRAEGLPGPVGGTVTWSSVVMGRKTARSTDPAERSDRDILETLIVPDRGVGSLPLGLRVVVEFLGD